jgi:hypothetical protein
MALLHELELASEGAEDVRESMAIYFSDVRPPGAQSRPLILQNVGTSRWQLYG